MPLVRFEVRNEYGLGAQELYSKGGGGANDDEDPKAILEGVTVAGLVGILRQLGDLAEFASEVFHDLQEQVMATASRSHKMIARVKHMEAALPALEKVVLAQKSHIHFAYTDGLEWHPKIQTEKNHLIYSDLPRFIMDSYEESRDPPSFHLLDKFDNGGPGSCLRRYSDPSFFKKALAGSELQTTDKVHREKKARKSKKMGLRQRNGEVSHAVSISRESGRMSFASPNIFGQSSATETFPTSNMRSKSELRDRSTYFDARTMEIRSTSFDSRAKLGHTECVFDVSSSTRHEDQDHIELSTSRLKFQGRNSDSSLPGEQESDEYDYYTQGSFPEQGVPSLSSVTWDEKIEIVKPTYPQLDKIFNDEKKATELLPSSSDLNNLEKKAAALRHVDPVDILADSETISESVSDGNQLDEVGSEPDSYVDALTTMESEIETDIEFQTKREVELPPTKLKDKGMECEAGVMDTMITQNSESFDVESPTTSYRLSNIQMAQNISNLVSSEDLLHAKPPKVNGMSSDPDFSVDTNLCSVSRANESDSTINCLAQVNVIPSDPEFSLETGLSSISRENDYDSAAINDPSSLGSNIPSSESPLGDKIIRRLHESEESLAKVSVAPSNKFWTNGGLLGLQPSKPPDFCVTDVVNESSMAGTKDDGHPLPSETFTSQTHSNGSIRKLDMLVEMPEHKKENPNFGGGNGRSHGILCRKDLPPDQLVRKTGSMIQNIDHFASSMPSHEKKDDAISKKNAGEILSAVSEAKIEKSVDSHCSSSSINDVHRPGLTETSFMTHGADLIIPSSEAGQQNGENPSNMHGLNHRLPVNGFGRKLSLVHDDKSEPAGSVKTGLMKLQAQYNKQEGQNRVLCQPSPKQNPNKQVRHVSPLNSPPLEHMKISFHPIKVFEPSSLKLKFPDGHQFQESIKDDMFPSFQLLPELSTSLQDLDYESDDDTFCRSSTYTSEEHMSQHSDSNSDQWESDETPESKEHEINDACRRFSSDESISSPFELEGMAYDGFHRDSNRSPDTSNGFIPFHDDPLLDFPSFDAVNPLTSKQEREINSDIKDNELLLHYPNEPTPPSLPIEPTPAPPPLPPLQWRIMKHNFSEVEDEQDTPSKDADHSHNLENPGTSPAQELKLAPSMQQHMEEATPSPPKIKLDQLNLNRNTEFNQASNGKDLEERGDFLQQIRTQSFSLRRTTPIKQTPSPSPTTNTKVSAILEKANAIRQAFVGSDDGGEDENWSDD